MTVVKCQLAWIESHLLPCLTSPGSTQRRPRRLLTSSNCSLLSDPDDTLSQSVLMSDTSVVQQTDVTTDAKDFVIALIKVSFCFCTQMAVCVITNLVGQRIAWFSGSHDSLVKILIN